MADITKYGPQNWRDLQKENSLGTEGLQSFDELTRIRNASMSGRSGVPSGDFSESISYGADNPMGNWGTSSYDDEIINAPMNSGEIQDTRYENQSWYDTLANGIGKMLGTAGTTFVSSLVGLPYGLYQAANQGRWSALWDNDVTQGLADVDNWLEENLTNYRSQVQQNSPWYSPDNLFSMNFIADDVIKNAGFTLGAAASMAVGSGAMGLMGKAMGFVNDVSKGTKMGQAALAALFSATGEGMIEARQGVDERNKLETQRLEDELAPEYDAIQMMQEEATQRYRMTGDYQTYKQQLNALQSQKQNLDARKQAGLQQIEESGQEMGNTILLANQALLTMGNLIQFGKGAVKSFDAARHAAEVTAKAAKPFGVSATKAGADLLRTGYKITGKNFGKTVAATKGLLTEGSEEMNQQWIQSGAGAYYNREDVNDYWKAKMDPEAYKNTSEGLYTFGKALDRGFQESWGDIDQWEQFLIGGLTGMAGSYSPTKLFNQDKTKGRLDPRRYGSWEGGAYNEISEFNRQYNQYEENINEVNRILQSEEFPERVRDMVGHTYTENEKMSAAEANDKKAFKDAEDKQFVHDVQSFLRAGKLDDLREIYKSMGENLSDEDVENIIKNTTKEVSAEEDKQNHDRMMDAQIAAAETDEEKAALQAEKDAYVGKAYSIGAYKDKDGNTMSYDEIRQTVKHNTEELNRKLDSYLDSIAQVNKDTNGALTKDQEDNLAYLHHLGRESRERADKIISEKRKQMPSRFLMKTEKTPEQLSKEYASSDLVFNKDENTKDGYVEVDTSLMDDRSFRNFFIGELLWGGNIDPEFGETADEKAAREEEEKNLSAEEKKKRAKERISKQWKDALKKRQKDAEEQRNLNGDIIAQHFVDNYMKNNNASQSDVQQALSDFFSDIVDASSLIQQSGEYDRTLREYMANPNKVDEDKAKEEERAEKEEANKQAKNKFEGKDSRQFSQEMADGDIDFGELSEFANIDDSDFDDAMKQAQGEAKKAVDKKQKANSLKNHIQENLGDNPTNEEIAAADLAMKAIDAAELNAESAEDMNINMPELSTPPADEIDPNISLEELDVLTSNMQDQIAGALNGFNDDTNAQDDIPETIPSGALDDVEMPVTGHDETAKINPEVKAPDVSSPSKAANNPIPKNPLTEGAITNIIKETSSAVNQTNTTGTWRSTTTRHQYGKSTGTYHETIADKDSVQYKRSKAIWEYLNNEHAFDRMDNADKDRIKPKDTVHFMVRYFPEIFGARLEEVSDENKPYAMAIIMMNDNGEVLGDLPLAELEPSFRSGNPTQQVKDLKALQDNLFGAFLNHYKNSGGNEAIVDSTLKKEGIDNLNLTFDNARKSPLVSRVKQVMRGAVPYRYGETNTLNEVMQGTPEIGVKVTGTTIAMKRGDKIQHKDIVTPNIGAEGQPYLLMPTASGEKIAVPFYMPSFNAEQHRNTLLSKHLINAVLSLLVNNSQTTASQKDKFMKSLDALKGVLQVEEQKGKKVISVRSNGVSLHLQSLTDPNQKIDIQVSSDSGNTAQIAADLVNGLSGIPINVSLQYLNDSIQTGDGAGALKSNYNQVIGEIANVNLPKATTHTVNSWFTVELTTQTGTKPSKAVAPKTTGTITENIGDRNIEIDTDSLTAVDTSTGEIIEDNEQVNLRLAQIKASKPLYKDKDFIQVSLGGEMRTYDVKNNKFMKNPSKPASTRRDFVKEITAAKTIKELIGIERTAQDAQANGIISADELIKLGSYINKKRADIYSETPDVSDTPTPKMAKRFDESIAKPSKPKEKTLEQIESEMKEKKIVGRQTKDAWDAIPDNLKMKLVNEGASLQLASFTEKDRIIKNKVVTISMSDREGMIAALKNANMAAKAGKISVTEAVKPMKKEGIALTRENEQSARRWLAKNLPSLSSEERTQFVDKIARAGDNAGKMWGSYRSGVIEIQRNAPEGTIYHEAFHYVMDMILSPEERQETLRIARDEYGISDSWAAEERLANDFRKYALDENAEGIVGKIKRLIRRLMDRIKRYNRISDATVNQLFWKINNGELAEKNEMTKSFEETQQDVLREIRNVQKDKTAWRNLPADTKSALKDSGLSEAAYNEMSLEEKEQYIKCRS